MPRAVSPKLVTSLVRRRDACKALGICRDTFWRVWHEVFTDPRSPEDRRAGCERKVFEDELATAVNAGGGTRARVAVVNFRGLVGRA